MFARASASWAWLLPLALLATACRSTAPAGPAGPPAASSSWVVRPEFRGEPPASRSIHVRCDDPARSTLGPLLQSSCLAQALEAKGYVKAESADKADYVAVLVVRYYGKTVPPGGRENLLARAGETILGGDESWLAIDGSGSDTQVRTPRAVRFRSGARSMFGEVFKGHQDDQWTLLVDVALGARLPEPANVVQRHEGRAWASIDSVQIDRAGAGALAVAEFAKLWADGLP